MPTRNQPQRGLTKQPESRIPLELQAVFIASNKGEDIEKVEAPKTAFRVFTNIFASFRGLKKRGNPKRIERSSSFDTVRIEEIEFDHESLLSANFAATPQKHMEAILQARGYSIVRHRALQTEFFITPTQYQRASYGFQVIKFIQDNDEKEVKKIMEAGLSPNACSQHSETLLHKACRLGYHRIVKVLLDHGVDVRVCDAYGRTVLHDTCWGARPSFQAFALLMNKDPSLLFMADSRGSCPLDYIKKDHYPFWLEYLDNNVDKYWPRLQTKQEDPLFGPPNSKLMPEPLNALSVELAAMVANGQMTAEEALTLNTLDSDDDSCSDSSFDESFSDDESCSDDECSSFNDDDFGIDNVILIENLKEYCIVPV